MDGSKVCAVVVNWNGREYIEPCLETLVASDYAPLEVLVVDNASTDGSPEFVRESFPSVGLLLNDRNEGYAAGANAGVKAALDGGADYVLLLNNDVELAPDAVARLVETAREHPGAAFVGPKIYYHEPPDVIWSLGGAVSYWSGNIRHIAIRRRDDGRYEGVREVDYVTGASILCASAALRRIGLMDEAYYMYNEDTDWCARAKRHGYSVLVEPRAKVWHKVSMSSGGGLTQYKVYHRLRSTLRFFSLYAKPYQWLGILPATLWRAAIFVATQIFTGKPGNAAAVVRGAFDSARGKGRS